jgi:uncharacterized protein YcfJ
MGLLMGAVIATAGGALAMHFNSPKSADIVSVTPITLGMEQEYAVVTHVTVRPDPNAPQMAQIISSQPIITPGQVREVCEDRVVTHQAPVSDQNQIAGTAAGAVIGGVLGNQVGGGNGKKAATVLGAIAGGVVGKKVQSNRQQQQTYQTTEHVCNTQRDNDRTSGYNVTVNIDGQTQNLTLPYNPKGQLPVVNGQLITDQAEIRRLTTNIAPPSYDVAYLHNNQPQVMQMDKAPKIGERFPIDNGQVLTQPAEIANLQSRSNDVVAYRVIYQSDNGPGEARMLQAPIGNTLALKNGKPVITASAQ